MKRFVSVLFMLVLTARYGFTDGFTDELQRLAMQTACIGQYNRAQTGNYTLGDPHDYYTPGDIREYLTRTSGSRTRTQTFYGVCFDYAQAAYDDLSQHRSRYEGLGMQKDGWYIAVAADNSRQISLYDPVSRDKATVIMNGVPLRLNSRQNVRTHGNATNHAWLWVYGNDGTIYWIDPTWTDNNGYIWWGMVRNGEEIPGPPLVSLCKVAVNPNDAAFADLNRGNASKNQSRWDQAIAEYTASLRASPNDPRVYYNRGATYYNKGDYDRAIADFNQALRLDPNSAQTYTTRGNAYIPQGGYDLAIADYTQALRLDSDFTNAYIGRGIAYSMKGDYDRGIADFNQALRLDPNSANAYANRGATYANGKRDYDRAIADFTQALRLDPNSASAYANRGDAYLSKGDYDRAIADCTEAIRLDPHSAAAYVDRSAAYYNGKRDYNRATADCEAALRIDPNHATARNNLEILRRVRGR